MILATDAWVYGKLNANSTLTNKLCYFYPNTFNLLPVIAYSTSNANTTQMDFDDDASTATDIFATIDIYTDNATDPTTLAQAVDSVMQGLLFTLESGEPVADPDAKTQHYHMRYSRLGVMPDDVI